MNGCLNINGRLTGAALITLLMISPLLPGSEAAAAVSAPAARSDVVNCLLPGQVRRMGSHHAYLTPRRTVRLATDTCDVRGGEQYDLPRQVSTEQR